MKNSTEILLLQGRARRLLLLGLIFFASLVIILWRLVVLQVFLGDTLLYKSEHNFCCTEVVLPKRGRLLDCFGRELATNEERYKLFWRGRTADAPLEVAAIAMLESLLNIRIDRDKLMAASLQHQKYLLVEDLSFKELCNISECLHSFNCFEVVPLTKRIYPYGTLASHILGYLGRDESTSSHIGRAGLESILQNALSGTGGIVEHMVNARGERLSMLNVLHPINGRDLKLTLDLDIQRFVETLMDEYRLGAIVIMDPATGAIKASASFPAFDPNRFLTGISHSEWNSDFLKDAPLLNRVFLAAYPPASIFKLVTCAAALETGIIDCETEVYCPGYFQFGGRKYNCSRSWGHGYLTALKSLAYSCNAFCFSIGSKLSIDQISHYANRFGLGLYTGSLLPEVPGIMPSMAWKQAVKCERWWDGETLSASVGQSYLLVTPIQIACMIGSIFTGYLVRPRILEEEAVSKIPLAISKPTQHFLRESMYEVVQHGTARLLREIDTVHAFAKTGTAQISNVRRGEKAFRQREHAWCTSYFWVEGQAPLVMVVLIEHAGMARPAVMMVERCLRYLSKRRQSLA